MTALVHGEYARSEHEFQSELDSHRRKLSELKTLQERAIALSRGRVAVNRKGIEALQKYDLLLTVRYTDEKGEFNPAAEIAPDDVENLNRLFKSSLRSEPLYGRVSASHTRNWIERGIEELRELVKIDEEPTERNNSELQIVAAQTREHEAKLKKALDLSTKLGFKVKTDASLAGGASAPATVRALATDQAPSAAPKKKP